QVSGPVIAVGLVLSAVFVPFAFISGITGMFFRQFALTIAVSTLISAFCSLTLSPALCALLLKTPTPGNKTPPLPGVAFGFIGAWLGFTLGEMAAPHLGLSWLAGWPWWGVPTVFAVVLFPVGWVVGWPINWVLGKAFALFNKAFGLATSLYIRAVGGML